MCESLQQLPSTFSLQPKQYMISNMNLSAFGMPFVAPGACTAQSPQGYPLDFMGIDANSEILVTNRSRATRPVPEFLYHLTRMLRDSANHHLIEWDAGRIIVHDPARLEAEVLGKYFRHSKYSSFQRQLNYFNFSKHSGKRKMSPCSYTNDNATDDLCSLVHLKRKSVKKPRKPHHASFSGENNTGNQNQEQQHAAATTNGRGSATISSGSTPDDSDNDTGGIISNGILSMLQQQQVSLKNQCSSLSAPAVARHAGEPKIAAPHTNKEQQQAVSGLGSQPFVVSAEEYHAPGECDALHRVEPIPLPPNHSTTRAGHLSSVVTPRTLDGSSEHSCSSATTTSALSQEQQELYKQIVAMPIPNLFSVSALQQQHNQVPEDNYSNTNTSKSQDQEENDHGTTHDDIATFLALESAFGGGESSEDCLSDGSTSADSWLPDPLL